MENTVAYTDDFADPVKETWRKHKKWIALLLLVKTVFIFSAGDLSQFFSSLGKDNIKTIADRFLVVNNDELLIAEVAINYNNGLGFVSANEIKRKKYPYDFTAFRPTYPVYMHIGLMQIYKVVFPDQTIIADKSSPYFRMYAGLLHILSFSLFAVSLFYFRALALLFLNEKTALAALIAYGLYPSVLVYVGSFANYESITMSMLIIIICLLIRAIHYRLKFAELTFLVLFTLLSSLFRPQVNFIFLFTFSVWFLYLFFNRKKQRDAFRQAVVLCITVPLLLVALNIPVLVKNHRLFGAYMLTTTGINISFGHNPYARGSWCGNCMNDPSTPYYNYIRKEINNFDELDEYEKSRELEKLSYRWIRENPMAELKLAARKIAIFFLPYNSDNNRFNIFNLLVHGGALLYCFRLFYLSLRRKFPSVYEWMLVSPLAGSITMCVVFHVGYRWRYFAEPFMILCALIYTQYLISKWFSLKPSGIQPGSVH